MGTLAWQSAEDLGLCSGAQPHAREVAQAEAEGVTLLPVYEEGVIRFLVPWLGLA